MTHIETNRTQRSTPWPSDGSARGVEGHPGDPMARRPVQGNQDITGQILEHASTLNLLFAMQVFSREQNKMQGESAIMHKKGQMDDALREEREAIKKAREEREEQAKWGGIKSKLSTIATGAMVAASAASVVVSGGASAPLAVALVGMAISMAAKPVGEAVGSKKLELGMQIGGALVSLAGGGAGVFSASSATSSTAAAGTAASSGATAGAASGATQALSTTTQVAATIQKGASVVSGAAMAAMGYATYQTGRHEALAGRAQADATEAGAAKRHLAREMDDLIELLKEAEKSFSKAKNTLRSASDSHAASNLTLATMGVRA